jgi:UDP-4-amino-4,6-dideoxy-N-acetyl-beta-L-altrosamine N-acetyltransferase
MQDFFSKYGIEFRLVLTQQDIEKLRIFRNLPHVRNQMFIKNEISIDSHFEWFDSLNVENNNYFIYGNNKEDIGVINLKDINFAAGTGEAGIFVGNQNYLNSHLNIGALLFLYDYAFFTVGLELLDAHILPTNSKAIRMNKSLGFTLTNANENLYSLVKSSYLQSKIKFEPLFLV